MSYRTFEYRKYIGFLPMPPEEKKIGPFIGRMLFEECPMCGSLSTHSKPYTYGDCSEHPSKLDGMDSKIEWLRCSKCEHVYTNGYFASDTFASSKDIDLSPVINSRAESARIVEKISSRFGYGKKPKRWLDVGFGSGSLLTTVNEFGYIEQGIDVKASSVQAMVDLGVTAKLSTFELFESDFLYDVISFADVLEHLPFPIEALSKANMMLRKGGVLYISCPNRETPIWRLLNAIGKNPYWNEVEHYHNFGVSQLSNVLSDLGLVDIRYSVTTKYIACMELIAVRPRDFVSAPSHGADRVFNTA